MFTISFSGRFNRMQYWGGTLITTLLLFLSVLMAKLSPILFVLMVPIIAVYGMSVSVRRGHDLGLSGWIVFIGNFVPVVNLVLFIYLGFFRGEPNENQYDN